MARFSALAMGRAEKLLRGLGWLMVPAWPLLVWLSVTHPPGRWLPTFLTLIFMLRILSLWGRKGGMGQTAILLALAGAMLCGASLALRDMHLLLWYPVAVNAVMLMLFGGSLFTAMPLVERLARLREPELPLGAVAYVRRVTQAWCLFFIINGGIALATCLAGSLYWWTLWNGMLGYLLMGLLMAGEWLTRRQMRARL